MQRGACTEGHARPPGPRRGGRGVPNAMGATRRELRHALPPPSLPPCFSAFLSSAPLTGPSEPRTAAPMLKNAPAGVSAWRLRSAGPAAAASGAAAGSTAAGAGAAAGAAAWGAAASDDASAAGAAAGAASEGSSQTSVAAATALAPAPAPLAPTACGSAPPSSSSKTMKDVPADPGRRGGAALRAATATRFAPAGAALPLAPAGAALPLAPAGAALPLVPAEAPLPLAPAEAALPFAPAPLPLAPPSTSGPKDEKEVPDTRRGRASTFFAQADIGGARPPDRARGWAGAATTCCCPGACDAAPPSPRAARRACACACATDAARRSWRRASAAAASAAAAAPGESGGSSNEVWTGPSASGTWKEVCGTAGRGGARASDVAEGP
ncbi:hypothetical protein Rsub_04078 [Raphidocelis subcapitata]|uniref:Uncharacterized protein n=1 Tax=Raphidocelis subcapitata TaxID=307507 RepID=A0A2V0NVV6_9CHLO|nr:hypothetical protein Rsub_04078 [Raphidocelis subcapitata]|eukprot:GBF91774.1 hypothetical protein Rsub_04078 [Raphidocelis subcapitata]